MKWPGGLRASVTISMPSNPGSGSTSSWARDEDVASIIIRA